jgi:hypothetical protein
VRKTLLSVVAFTCGMLLMTSNAHAGLKPSLIIAGPSGSLNAGQPEEFGCNATTPFSQGVVTFYLTGQSSETGSSNSNGSTNVDYTFSSLDAGSYQAHCTYGAATSNFVQFTIAAQGYTGYIGPKYLVVGLIYAPPGVNSTVAYSASNTVSNTSNFSSIFGTSSNVTVKITGTTGVAGVLQGKVTGTTSTTANQSTTSTNSATVTFGQTVQNTYAGTPVFNMPIAHDYDSVLLWLNPVTILTVFPSQPAGQQIQFNGYGYDEADTNVQGPDILSIPIGCLNGDFAAANCQQYATELNRSWASSQIFPSGQGPALTATDYAQIVSVDPFTNANYVFTPVQGTPITTIGGRFTLSGGPNGTDDYFTYSQAQPGQQPNQYNLANTYTNMSVTGQSSSSGYMQTFGVDASFTGGIFLGDLMVDIGITQTLNWTNTAGTSVTSSNTQTDNAVIKDPACNGTVFCSPASTAPLQWNVYQDNVYGSFEFQP